MAIVITEDMLGKIFIGVCTSLILAGFYYVVREFRRYTAMLVKHDKVLFGDADISEWEGLVKMAISAKRYSITERRAFIAVVQTLIRNDVIKPDSELNEAISALKRDD